MRIPLAVEEFIKNNSLFDSVRLLKKHSTTKEQFYLAEIKSIGKPQLPTGLPTVLSYKNNKIEIIREPKFLFFLLNSEDG